VVVYMSQASGGLDVKDGTTQPKAMGFRDYGVGAQILAALGLQQIRLLSSTMRRVVALDGYGLEIIETVPLRKDD